MISSASLAQELRAEPIIHAQLEQLKTVSKFLFSVGTCDPDSHIVVSGIATLDDLAWYCEHGAIGVLCGRFIDENGNVIPGPMTERMIGIPVNRLVGPDMGILVAPSIDKLAATIAAIRGGYLTHLACGLSLAEALLAP